MKKLLCLAVAVAMGTVCAFASTFQGDVLVEKFFAEGKYIKVVEKDKVGYYNKEQVMGINVDDGTMTVFAGGVYSPARLDGFPFSVKKWNIESDASGNIIVTKK